jgi:hypothetical protein
MRSSQAGSQRPEQETAHEQQSAGGGFRDLGKHHVVQRPAVGRNFDADQVREAGVEIEGLEIRQWSAAIDDAVSDKLHRNCGSIRPEPNERHGQWTLVKEAELS